MTIISKDSKLVTLINVFTVEPANQQRLVDLLDRVTETSVRHAPGFVSASLHRSVESMRKDPTLASLQEAMTYAKFEPGVYEVVDVFTGR